MAGSLPSTGPPRQALTHSEISGFLGSPQAGGGPGPQVAPERLAPLDQHLLDLGDGLGRVQALRAGAGAVHDGVAAIEPERVLELVEPLARMLVAAVGQPAIGLQQDGGAEIAVAVPPIAGTAGRAAEAE